MVLAKFLIQLMIDTRVTFYRFEKDVFDKSLALFHMKEQLILQILVQTSDLIDTYSQFYKFSIDEGSALQVTIKKI